MTCSSLFYNVFVFSYLRHGVYHGGIDVHLFCYLSLPLAYLSNHCPSCEISWNICSCFCFMLGCYCFSFSSQIFSWFSGFLFQHHHVRISGTFQTGCCSTGGWYESLLCSCYVFYRSKKLKHQQKQELQKLRDQLSVQQVHSSSLHPPSIHSKQLSTCCQSDAVKQFLDNLRYILGFLWSIWADCSWDQICINCFNRERERKTLTATKNTQIDSVKTTIRLNKFISKNIQKE